MSRMACSTELFDAQVSMDRLFASFAMDHVDFSMHGHGMVPGLSKVPQWPGDDVDCPQEAKKYEDRKDRCRHRRRYS